MADFEAVNLPARDAVDYFRAKGYHIGFSWLDTDAAQHTRSFTVAKAMSLDILQDIRAEMDRVLAEGRTFEQFVDDLKPTLQRKGWWGQGLVRDPVTGEMRKAQLGSVRRLRTIFDVNFRTAHAKGQWERIRRVADARPFLQYMAMMDGRTRPSHARMHNTILPWDHAFWRAWYPPNGWNCRCLVNQYSKDDLRRLGLAPSTAPPEGWDQGRRWQNKRTGKSEIVPDGIDPGWAHNVGLVDVEADDADRLIMAIDAAPSTALRRAAVGVPPLGEAPAQPPAGDPFGTPMFRRHLRDGGPADWPVAVIEQHLRDALEAQSWVVRLRGVEAAQMVAAHNLTARQFAICQRIIDAGNFIQDASGVVYATLQIDAQWWRLDLQAINAGRHVMVRNLRRIPGP